MPLPTPIVTERLLLRAWHEEDRAPFAALNADPQVMAHFPASLTRAESDDLAERLQQQLATQGWGVWALALRASGTFIGFTGLAPGHALRRRHLYRPGRPGLAADRADLRG